MKRVNVFLADETMPTLKEIIQKMRENKGGSYHGYYSLTASDLIRYALDECFGIKFYSPHYYDKDRLKRTLAKTLKKKKSAKK